jgi:hypothetical protein
MSNAAAGKEFSKQIVARAAKDDAFREEFIKDPKAVLAREFARQFPDAPALPNDLKVKVVEQEDDTVYVTLPKSKPIPTRELRDEELAGVAGGGTWSCPTCQNTVLFSLFDY